MTNAVYATESLHLKEVDTAEAPFEKAILDYFKSYGPSRTRPLTERLSKHDFSSVKANFIASIPGKFQDEAVQKWGLGRLRHLLKSVESHPHTELFGQV
jgi:tyrosyl-DNA phosphodiesterase 1